jgi:hypothetical protein
VAAGWQPVGNAMARRLVARSDGSPRARLREPAPATRKAKTTKSALRPHPRRAAATRRGRAAHDALRGQW